MQIRWMKASDGPALAWVFFDAVREGPSPYSAAQRAAWMPRPPDPADFAARLRRYDVAVAEMSAEPVGFMAMTPDGYIDLAFVLPQHRGHGLFRKLYARLESHAIKDQLPRLTVHASLGAQAAFQRVGFTVIRHETVERAGEVLRRAKMEKILR